MKIDLHNHTNYSDGVMTPEELLIHAKERNVDIMALTDHDSVFGCEEIEELSKKYGVKIIKGMELSTYYDNVRIARCQADLLVIFHSFVEE